jgi:phytoene synthase
VVRTAREPILAQLRLAWWRDRFASDPAGWPKGEPLLARLAGWEDRAGLGALVDGWEALLGDDADTIEAVTTFAEGRASAAGALALQLGSAGAEGPARRWALAERALAGYSAARGLIGTERSRVARPMRPLAVLSGLTQRAAARGETDVLSGPGALFAAIRLGITGGPA